MRIEILFLAAGLLLTLVGHAQAQVPVNDAARLNDETSIANCMEKAKAATDATTQPEQQIHGSVSTPGTAGQSGQVGSASVTGATDGGFAIPAVGDIGDEGTVDGIDFAPILGIAGSIETLRGKNLVQGIAAAAAIATTLARNNSDWRSVSSTIGSVDGIQAAVDQNSGIRVGTAAVWNQVVQAGNTRLSLLNQQLIDQSAASAAQARVMTYEQSKAGFVPPDASTPETEQTIEQGLSTYGNILRNLNDVQAAARSNDRHTRSLAGQ